MHHCYFVHPISLSSFITRPLQDNQTEQQLALCLIIFMVLGSPLNTFQIHRKCYIVSNLFAYNLGCLSNNELNTDTKPLSFCNFEA